MLGHKVIIFTNDAKMQTLYNILNKGPAKEQMIKHLHFTCHEDDLYLHIIHDISRLAFTPSTQAITGFICGAKLFDTLITIVQHSATPFDKLKVQQLLSNINEYPLKLALEFQGSLQSLQLDVSSSSKSLKLSVINNSKEFQELISLVLAFFALIDSLDALLGMCLPLVEMSLRI